jgi:predicted Rossmann fold flavoprotein
MPTIAVIGAGAAGLMAAISAARALRLSSGQAGRVVVFEKTPDGGRKILISGGGRCNVLPSVAAPERFVSAAPAHLVRRMLRAFPLHEQREFFERDAGIPLALEEESGKLFPTSNRARDVRDALVRLAREAGAEFRWGTPVTSIEDLDVDRVILASGGLSVPATGSDGGGLEIARRLGHKIVPTYAALTPLLTDDARHTALSGLSLRAETRAPSAGKHARSGAGFLFTHRGFSGPSVLDVSHGFTRDRGDVLVSWGTVARDEWEAALADRSGQTATKLAAKLPARLVDLILHAADIPVDRRMAELRKEERARLLTALTAYRLPVTGDEGYKKAEVTGGGVALDEVDPSTLESRRRPGLYFCGEILDCFGPIGGHNFMWAWSTGRSAGRAAAGV